jgi:hypothetical protein
MTRCDECDRALAEHDHDARRADPPDEVHQALQRLRIGVMHIPHARKI